MLATSRPPPPSPNDAAPRAFVSATARAVDAAAPPPAHAAQDFVTPARPVDDIALPARPTVLVQLSLMLADDAASQADIAALIAADMALAAAVLKAANASFYALRTRARSVHEAITYLGTREVAGLTYELALRAAFPPAVELAPVWERASQRGLWMGRIAQALGADAWAAHSAGIFEECGKAALFRHAPDHHRAMLRAACSDVELGALERAGFGIAHDALGAQLCRRWGLADATSDVVARRLELHTTRSPAADADPATRRLQAIALVVHAWMTDVATLDDTVDAMATAADLDVVALRRVCRGLPERRAKPLHAR